MDPSIAVAADRTKAKPRIRSSDIVFSMKLFVLAVGCAGAVLLMTMSGIGFVVAGCVLFGLWQAHAVELQHQVIHGLGYRSGPLNHFAGVVLGVPMLVSFSSYRASHLRHHRHLGTPDNKEFFDYGDQYGARPLTALQIMERLLMFNHYRTFAEAAVRSLRGLPFDGESQATSRNMRTEYLVMLACIVAMVVTGVVLHEWRPLIFWACSLVLVATPVHALIEMPEHFMCDTSTTDVFQNTRSIKSNQFLTWFTNGNNFHVEHHLSPGLPMEMLPDLFEQNVGRHRHVERTYRDFFRRVRRGAFRDTPAAP